MASSPFINFNIIFLMILLLPSNTVAAPPSLTSTTVAAPSSLTLDLTTSIRYDNLNFNVVLKGITYLMMLFVGTPEPQQILVNFDTSSDVVWTLGNPASKEANFYEFDPKSSWSYSPISCYDAVSCSKDLPNRHCGNHYTYDYTLDYGFDNSPKIFLIFYYKIYMLVLIFYRISMFSMKKASEVAALLDLKPHPEGGYYSVVEPPNGNGGHDPPSQNIF